MANGATAATITAEWAHWGKKETDPEYNLLSCSKGTLTAHDFEQVLSRYSPGTLGFKDLPQVTISWLSKDRKDIVGGKDYLGLAIYYEAEEGRVDVSGRNVMFTDYFCVPYEHVAACSASYLTIYDSFRESKLQHAPAGPIEVALATAAPSQPYDVVTRLAMRAAVLLLTDKPVCVLGADALKLTDRIMFLDLVASYLPYGMRARLSAGTWASSTFRKHQLRIFFASADRDEGDHLVTWGQVDMSPIQSGLAMAYSKHLFNQTLTPEALAGYKDVTGFKLAHVARTLPPLFKNAPPPQPIPPVPTPPEERFRWPPAAGHPLARRRSPAADIPEPDGRSRETVEMPDDGLPPTAEQPFDSPVVQFGGEPNDVPVHRMAGDLEEILNSCRFALDAGDSDLLGYGQARLREFRRTPHGVERSWIRESISSLNLLRPDVAVSGDHLRPFYAELLKLAYTDGGVFRINGYRFVVDQLGTDRLPPAHAWAMIDAGLEGPSRLLLQNSLGPSDLQYALEHYAIPPAQTVAMMVDPVLDETDASAVLDAALKNLVIRKEVADSAREQFRKAMHDKHLITVLQDRYSRSPQDLLGILIQIFAYAYGNNLHHKAADAIFANIMKPPSPSLLGAMLRVAKDKHHPAIIRSFAFYSVRWTELNVPTRDEVERAISHARRWRSPQDDPVTPVRNYGAPDFIDRFGIAIVLVALIALITVVVFVLHHLSGG